MVASLLAGFAWLLSEDRHSAHFCVVCIGKWMIENQDLANGELLRATRVH